MLVEKNGNVLTLKTGIPAKFAGENLVAVNDKKEEVYRVEAIVDIPYLSKYGLGANAIIDDELAVVITVDPDASDEAIKKNLGMAAVAANVWCPVIADGKALEEATINEMFNF